MNRQIDRVVAMVALSSLIAAISIAVVILFFALSNDGFSSDSPAWAAPAFILWLLGLVGICYALLVSSRSVQRDTLSIALAGLPEVGKTVYVNMLFAVLMEGKSAELLFTPESRTARAVYQMTRRMRTNQWPSPTATSEVVLYKGTIDLRTDFFVKLVWGRKVLAVEIADAPGEIWEQSVQETAGLIDSNYFDYVAASDAVFYFISSEDILANPDRVEESVSEAIETFQLIRSARSKTILVPIVSKADLLPIQVRKMLSELFDNSREFSIVRSLEKVESFRLSSSALKSLYQIERFVSVTSVPTSRLAERGFLVSSFLDGKGARLMSGGTGSLWSQEEDGSRSSEYSTFRLERATTTAPILAVIRSRY